MGDDRMPVLRLPDDVDGRVIVFAHVNREDAERAARINRDEYGHPCEVAERSVWVSVVDLGPAIEAADRYNAEHGQG